MLPPALLFVLTATFATPVLTTACMLHLDDGIDEKFMPGSVVAFAQYGHGNKVDHETGIRANDKPFHQTVLVTQVHERIHNEISLKNSKDDEEPLYAFRTGDPPLILL